MNKQVIPLALVLIVTAVLPTRAQFTTGFETSSGYGGNGVTAIGVQDTSAPSGSTWANVTGFGNSVTTSTASAKSGLQSLRILDSSTGAGTAAEVNLSGTTGLNLANPFKIQFSWAYTAAGGTAGSALNAWFGIDSNSTSAKDWMHVSYDTSTDYLGIYLSNVAGTSSTLQTLAKFSDLASTGTYVSWSLTINPTTHTYTNVTLGGDLSSVDVTSLVQSVNSGTIPWKSSVAGDPSGILWFNTGSAATITAFVDDISISNVPEPSSYALLALSFCLLLGLMRRRQSVL